MGTTTPRSHRAFFSDLGALGAGDVVDLVGEEAHHLARVRRARVGDLVELIDGNGGVAATRVEGVEGTKSRTKVVLAIGGVRRVEPTACVLEVCAPAPKGDRLDRMVDQLTQIGAAAWRPLVCEHAERDPGSIRRDKLERHVIEACKQSGRAHLMTIGDPITLDEALGDPGSVVLDASGSRPGLDGLGGSVRVLVGPEGGWSDAERGVIASSGRRVWALGPHVQRIETAAVSAAAVVLSLGGA